MSSPKVSVIVPCYNERRTIGLLLDAMLAQDFPASNLEVVVSDGLSSDGTRDIVREYAGKHRTPAIRLIDNPERAIPFALNRAIRAACGEVLIRVDAHSVPGPDYVSRCVSILRETGAANVGGQWRIAPSHDGWMARSIAHAATHRLGAGDARYRVGGEAGPVDTVPFGAFDRKWLDVVGLFDESLSSNEDYELNVRLRAAGGRVWFDPRICSTYFARGTLVALARQYGRYGYWKARMLRRHPRSLRWRQAVPPVFVLSLFVLGAAALLVPQALLPLGLLIVAYAALLAAAAVESAVRLRDPAVLVGLPLAICTMHLAWGGGFVFSTLTMILGRVRPGPHEA